MGNLNCHFVSRFLTTPWEFGERQLHFYDVKTRMFGQRSSKNLFAVAGLNSDEIEARINRLVETPLARAIVDLARSSGPDGYSISDWSIYRALALLFHFQVARAAVLSRGEGDLATLCSWPDEQIDQLAWASHQRYRFITVRAHRGSPFFYPSKGYFVIPLAFASALMPGAIAIPLTENWAVASVPTEIDTEQLTQLLSYAGGGLASNASVGTNSELLVIHPSVMACTKEDEIRQHIEEMQANNLTLLQELVDFNRNATLAFAEAGLPPSDALAWVAELGSSIRSALPGAAEQAVAADDPAARKSG